MMNVKYEQILETALREHNSARTPEQKENAVDMLHNVVIMVGKYNYSSANMTEVYKILNNRKD